MSKEFEALEIINTKLKDKNNKYDRRVVNCSDEYLYLIKEEELDIIETALKDYEETDNQLYDLFEEFGINNRKDLLKKLKALEIIKKKRVNIVELLDFSNSIDEYNDFAKSCLSLKVKQLTQEEYDLLKEVLL